MSKNNPIPPRVQVKTTTDSKRPSAGTVGVFGGSSGIVPQRQSLTVGTLGVNTQRNGNGTQPSNKAPQRTTNTIQPKNDRNMGGGAGVSLPSNRGFSGSDAAEGSAD